MSHQILYSRFLISLILPPGGFTQNCPDGESPLLLDPPRVVVRYGDSVSVDCSTSTTDHDGMGWEASQGGTGFEEVSTITWRVEKLTDWHTEPKCYMTLEGGEQPKKTLSVTLYSKYVHTVCSCPHIHFNVNNRSVTDILFCKAI